MGWEPITSAPLDGAEVDLWDGVRRVPNCHYHCGDWLWWNSTSVDDEPTWITVKSPTHWRPIPKAPASVQQNGGGDCSCHFRGFGDCDCGKDYRAVPE